MQAQSPPPKPDFEKLRTERARLLESTLAPNTLKGYHYAWESFRDWCTAADLTCLPASTETVTFYVTALLQAGKKITTAHHRVCAIAHTHRTLGFSNPVTNEVYSLLQCAQRVRAEKPHQMRPLSLEQLRSISAMLRGRGSERALRDRALFVLGWTSALRRSSIAALRMADVEFADEGLIVHLQREKNDPAGKGRLIGVPRGKHPDTDVVGCLSAWLKFHGGAEGPLFYRLTPSRRGEALNGQAIMRIVKKRIAQAGLEASRFGPHSMRSGFITECGLHSVGDLLIAATTGHRSMAVLHRYFRRTNLWKANAAGMIGL